MDNDKKFRVSVIVPVYNGETTILKTLESLDRQTVKPDEIIVINDGSRDQSPVILKEKKIGLDYKLISHEKSWGLARTYNQGIKCSTGDLMITMHQDVILMEDALEKLISPFSDDEVVVASHIVIHPIDIWRGYNFWQKCFFARLVGKDFSGIDGKFDCFRKESLEKVGFFNERFRSAGEDGDMVFRLQKVGKIVDTEAKIIHIHKNSQDFSWKDIVHKQKQYSEAQGVLLRLGRNRNIENIARAFFREILLVLLLVPYVRYFSLFVIILYSFWYTKAVFLEEYRNPRILFLPFLNIYLLFVSFFYSLRGFLSKKQLI